MFQQYLLIGVARQYHFSLCFWTLRLSDVFCLQLVQCTVRCLGPPELDAARTVYVRLCKDVLGVVDASLAEFLLK